MTHRIPIAIVAFIYALLSFGTSTTERPKDGVQRGAVFVAIGETESDNTCCTKELQENLVRTSSLARCDITE